MFNNNFTEQNPAQAYYPQALHFNDETKQENFTQTQNTQNNFQANNSSSGFNGFNMDGLMNMFKNSDGNDMLSTLLASGMFGGANVGQQNPMFQMMSQMLNSQNKKESITEKKENVIISDTSFEEM